MDNAVRSVWTYGHHNPTARPASLSPDYAIYELPPHIWESNDYQSINPLLPSRNSPILWAALR